MDLRRWFGLTVLFFVIALALAGAFREAPDLMARFSNWPPAAVAGLMGAGLALGVVLLVALTDRLMRPQPAATADFEAVIDKFNQSLLGLVDEQTLAQVTGDILETHLTVRVTGWLVFTAHEATLTAQMVPGRGDFPAGTFELARQNVLVRQLTLRREPVRQVEVEADTLYAQMPAAERQWLKQLHGALYAPVFEGGLLTAVLVVGAREGRRPFRPGDIKLAALLAAQAGLAWKTIRQQHDAQRLHLTISQLEANLRLKDEAAAKIDSSRGDFLAIASHELRTPITQLLGFADLLGAMAQDNSLDVETIVHVTDSIVRACGRLNEVISQILDMAQLDVNALDLKFSTITLETVLRQAIEPYVPAMRERRLALKISGLKGLPALQADEQRLVQAFSQLMSNAVKYTPDGGKVEITLRLLPAENNLPPNLEIVFADSGIGIDPQYQRLIFDKFFRIGSAAQHSTSTTKFMGAGPGLGLPIAKGVVERHGGHLWVESDGCDPAALPGSRFIVRLPLKPPAFDPRALAAEARPAAAEPGDRARDSRPNIQRTPFIES